MKLSTHIKYPGDLSLFVGKMDLANKDILITGACARIKIHSRAVDA